MMLTGMARMCGVSQNELDELTASLGLPGLIGAARLERRSVNEVAGWGCRVVLPEEHSHRSLADILGIIEKSALTPRAAQLAGRAFRLLADAEGAVHGRAAEDVCFHEVGALDSILDMCLVCALFARLDPARFVCGPLPLADGSVRCAHGILPVPAPAVLELLRGVPVCGFSGTGETVTPTAIALLKALEAEFAPWPSMVVRETALVYGSKIFADAPNGSVWAVGPAFAAHTKCPSCPTG